MATSTLSTIQSSLNRKRLRLPPPPPPPLPISISFQFHKIVKTSAATLPLKLAKAYLIKGGLALNLQRAVGLNGISLCKDPYSLSGEYKRRLALAIQLHASSDECYQFNIQFKVPDMLVLDEPLVGLATCSQPTASVLKVLGALRHKGFLEPRCKARALI
ncbi:hypothetical protein Peur_001263 [Populus x canadensis]